MITSILLHLDHVQRADAVIQLGVRLAKQHGARLRGASFTDTRRIQALRESCEAAATAVDEQRRLRLTAKRHGAAKSELSQACLAAELNFDIRTLRGDPFELLPLESRCHDLVIASYRDPQDPQSGEDEGFSARELIDLAHRGVQPLLIARRAQQSLQRTLLVYDGTPASGRAIRSFVSQSLTPLAEHRLLAIGDTDRQARDSLQEMTEYFRRRRISLETGWIRGAPRKVLIPYAEKWHADLVVLGTARGSPVLRRLFGEFAQDALKALSAALYLAA